MTISNGASLSQIVNAVSKAQQSIETLQRVDQAPTYQPYDLGTASSGTISLDAKNGKLQYVTNNGAHTLTPPTDNAIISVLYTNAASAGGVTTSSFTRVDGSFTTTNTHKFLCRITVINSVSHLEIIALQ